MITYKSTRFKLLVVVSLLLFLACFAEVNLGVGGFPSGEYRLTLINRESQALTDLTAFVTDEQGKPAFNYPVVNYQPDRLLTANESGQIVLQHINLGAEFTTKRRKLFFVYPIVTKKPPEYYITFQRDKTTIATIKYSTLLRLSREMPHSETSDCDLRLIHFSSDLEHRFLPRERNRNPIRELPVYNITLKYPYKYD